LRKVGLSQGGFLTLAVLNRDPENGLTPSELSEKIGINRGQDFRLDILVKKAIFREFDTERPVISP
jgi:hypothetical protein